MSNSENNHPHDTQGINTLKRDSVIRLVDDGIGGVFRSTRTGNVSGL